MKNLELIPKFFEFELDDEGDVNSVDIPSVDETEDVKHEVGVLIDEWVNNELIELGEKTECRVWKEDTHFFVQVRVCTELGEDYDSDVWEDSEQKIDF